MGQYVQYVCFKRRWTLFFGSKRDSILYSFQILFVSFCPFYQLLLFIPEIFGLLCLTLVQWILLKIYCSGFVLSLIEGPNGFPVVGMRRDQIFGKKGFFFFKLAIQTHSNWQGSRIQYIKVHGLRPDHILDSSCKRPPFSNRNSSTMISHRYHLSLFVIGTCFFFFFGSFCEYSPRNGIHVWRTQFLDPVKGSLPFPVTVCFFSFFFFSAWQGSNLSILVVFWDENQKIKKISCHL